MKALVYVAVGKKVLDERPKLAFTAPTDAIVKMLKATICGTDHRAPSFEASLFLAEAGCGRTIAKYRKAQTIFSQGEIADSVFYIQRGKVKITIVSEQGREAVTAIIGEDEFIGVGCLAGQPRRITTATTMVDCEIMRIEKQAIIRALHDHPAFSEMLLAHTLRRTIRVEEDLVDQLFNSSEKRLARALLLLANFGKEGRPETTIEKISQETLAEMIGTTRSRVSFFMNKFRKLGFISYNGKIEVHSSLLSVVLSDHPPVQEKPQKILPTVRSRPAPMVSLASLSPDELHANA